MSVLAPEARKMGTKKVGRPKGENNRGVGRPVRLDPDIVSKAKVIAMRANVDVGQYLSGLLRGAVDKDYLKTVREMSAEVEGRK
jgi:hypothetical protein